VLPGSLEINPLVVLVCAGIVAAYVLALQKAKKTSTDEGLAFDNRDTLFSPAERSFLGVLEQSLDPPYRAFGKVRLGDLVKPAKGLSASRRTTGQNKINQKHVDFVVCLATDLSVVGVVELDDQSHGREDRAGRDVFVDQALAGAKIPVLRFSAKKSYQPKEVRRQLAQAFHLPSLTILPTKEELSPLSQRVTNLPVDMPPFELKVVPPICPKCSTTMLPRQAKTGAHVGKRFWACSAYPKCRQLLTMEDWPLSGFDVEEERISGTEGC